MQIPYLTRHCRVVTFDGRGNGRSDRPRDPEAYDEREFAADALAVLDATDTKQAVLVSLSLGAQRALVLAGEHPERVLGAAFIAPAVPLGDPPQGRVYQPFQEPLTRTRAGRSTTRTTGCATTKASPSSSSRSSSRSRTRPSRSRTASGGALETTAETLIATHLGPGSARRRRASSVAACSVPSWSSRERRTRSPGRAGASRWPTRPAGASSCWRAPDTGRTSATRSRSTCCCATSSAPPPPARWVRGRSRRKRALYVSSPIGLGHARRDVAIADELRKLHPDLEIDWLAQHPVTAVLESRRERIHPASALARQRVAPHRERVGRARPALLPGDPADGRDPARELHGLPRSRARRAVRPVDRRRGVGARLLPPREPGAEARGIRLADRLRRLAADARRRRARGVRRRRTTTRR